MTREEHAENKTQASMYVREIGNNFIKKFQGYYHIGKVIRIFPNVKRVFEFKDNENEKYSRDKLENFAKTVSTNTVILYDNNEGDTEDGYKIDIESNLKSSDESV